MSGRPPSQESRNKFTRFMRWYFTRANRAEEFERLPTNHTFPDAELIEITDRDVRDFMNVMAFGTTTPSNDARPTMSFGMLWISYSRKTTQLILPSTPSISITASHLL